MLVTSPVSKYQINLTAYSNESRYQRASPSKANNISCADWQDECLSQGRTEGFSSTAISLRRDIEAVEDETPGNSAKRRRNKKSIASKNSRESHQSGETLNQGNLVVPSDLVENATNVFMKKFKNGLKKLKEKPKLAENPDIGSRLAEHVKQLTDNGTEIEAILEDSKRTQKSNIWLVDFHHLFVSYRRRRLNLFHSETGDHDKERRVKEKEFLCEFLSLIVNGLEPRWGICASLVYNVLERKYLLY
jgi:hypothetical protein